MFGYYIDPYYVILVMPALVLCLVAQFMVSRNYSKYEKVKSLRGITASDAARKILDQNGLSDIKIERVSGNLTDHYDPKARVIRLSDSVHNSDSVAAIGIAAHEAGHAVQHSISYVPLKMRNAIYPVVNISSQAAVPLAVLGFILGFPALVDFGIILFSFVVLFQLITLPVEFNASTRAIKILGETNILDYNELKPVKKVLSAAAMTYLASALMSIANLLRLILLNNRRR